MAGVYTVITIVLTWPLLEVIGHEVPSDLGDPLFNCWVLNWTGGQVLRFLHGDWHALALYWQGNIFYPAPYTLAYSEHLTPQMLSILPVLGATHNIVLCYNLALLSTFVLSGLGTYLLVRDLTGRPLAAFLAGLAFAFAPYRLDQYGHLEVVSSQWMPFALLGLRRFFVSGRLTPLAWGCAALAAQALSCGYYLAYFPPFVVAYCLYEMISRGQLRSWRTWRALVAGGIATACVIGPFVAVYFHARAVADIGVRPYAEIEALSADSHAFVTVSDRSRLLHDVMHGMPRAEGFGFPGFTILAFGVVAVAVSAWRAVRAARRAPRLVARWRLAIVGLLVAIGAALVYECGTIFVHGFFDASFGGDYSPIHNAGRAINQIVLVMALLLCAWPAARRWARGTPGSDVAFVAWAALAAAWMSMGPMMHAVGVRIGKGLYNVFYEYVPGFNGLRVTTLNFMLVALFLAVLAGLGAAALLERWRRIGAAIVIVGMIGIGAEYWDVPIALNSSLPSGSFLPAPTVLRSGDALSPAYQAVAALPDGAVLFEFPFGEPAYDIQYTFYAGYHRKPIVNGYSGYFPETYRRFLGTLSYMPSGDDAWRLFRLSGATHVIVHESAYPDYDGAQVSAWLTAHGAELVLVAGGDSLFRLPAPR